MIAMDQYIEAKECIKTQDDYRCDEYTVSLPSKLFKEIKEADSFVKAFYWSPEYIMKEIEWKRIEVKPKTSVKFIKKENWRYYYNIIQERILPKKEEW